MSNTSYITIDWPQWWKGKGHHCLEGMPFIGTHCKVIRTARLCLQCRSQDLFKSVWSTNEYSIDQCRSVSEKVREIVHAYIAWPNYYFLPEDRVAILLGVIPGVWYDAEDPVEDVRKAFHLKGVKDGDASYYDVVLDGKYKDLLDMIIKLNSTRCRESGTKHENA